MVAAEVNVRNLRRWEVSLLDAESNKDYVEINRICNQIGVFYDREMGDYETALGFHERELDAAMRSGCIDDVSMAYQRVGWVNEKLGKLSAAKVSYEDQLKIAQRHELIREEQRAFASLGNLHREIGDRHRDCGEYTKAEEAWKASLKHLEDSLIAAEKLPRGDDERLEMVQNFKFNLGLLHSSEGKSGDAIIAMKGALAIAEERRDKEMQGFVLENLALEYKSDEQFDVAKEYALRKRDLQVYGDGRVDQAYAYLLLGDICHSQHDYDGARQYFKVFQDVRTQLDITEDASKELCRAVRCGSRQRRVETKVEQLAEEGDGCDRFSLQKEVVELYLQLEQPCLAVDYVRAMMSEDERRPEAKRFGEEERKLCRQVVKDLVRGGKPSIALELVTELLKVDGGCGRREYGWTMKLIGDVWNELRRGEEAAEAYEMSLCCAKDVGSVRDERVVLERLRLLSSNMGGEERERKYRLRLDALPVVEEDEDEDEDEEEDTTGTELSSEGEEEEEESPEVQVIRRRRRRKATTTTTTTTTCERDKDDVVVILDTESVETEPMEQENNNDDVEEEVVNAMRPGRRRIRSPQKTKRTSMKRRRLQMGLDTFLVQDDEGGALSKRAVDERWRGLDMSFTKELGRRSVELSGLGCNPERTRLDGERSWRCEVTISVEVRGELFPVPCRFLDSLSKVLSQVERTFREDHDLVPHFISVRMEGVAEIITASGFDRPISTYLSRLPEEGVVNVFAIVDRFTEFTPVARYEKLCEDENHEAHPTVVKLLSAYGGDGVLSGFGVGIGGVDVVDLIRVGQSLTRLKNLNLSANLLVTDRGVEALIEEGRRSRGYSELEVLGLASTGMTTKGFTMIVEALREEENCFPRLRKLYVGWNGLGEDVDLAARSLARLLRSNRHFSVVDLSRNFLTADFFPLLVSQIGKGRGEQEVTVDRTHVENLVLAANADERPSSILSTVQAVDALIKLTELVPGIEVVDVRDSNIPEQFLERLETDPQATILIR